MKHLLLTLSLAPTFAFANSINNFAIKSELCQLQAKKDSRIDLSQCVEKAHLADNYLYTIETFPGIPVYEFSFGFQQKATSNRNGVFSPLILRCGGIAKQFIQSDVSWQDGMGYAHKANTAIVTKIEPESLKCRIDK